MDNYNVESFVDVFEEKFIGAVRSAYESLGETAFHNISQSNPDQLVDRFSPTLFDSILIAFYLAERDGIEIPDPPDVARRKFELLKNPGYQRLLTQETMRVSNIRERIFRAYIALFQG
jgi:glutathione S-transferase